MHGVAEGIEERADLRGHLFGQGHHIEGGQAQIVRERALAVHADALRLRVEVEAPGAAGGGVQIDDVPFAGHPLPHSQGAVDGGADLDDLARELMPDDHRGGDRGLRPGVPVVDVHVRAADGGVAHTDQHVLRAGLRDLRLDAPDARLGVQLGKSAHGLGHDCLAFIWSRTSQKAEMTFWICASVCAAESWVRMRASPRGTTGKEKPVT